MELGQAYLGLFVTALVYFGTGLRLWYRAQRLKPDVICANFTGRGVFRKYKLLFFLLNVRQRLAFNAGLQFYPLTLRNLPRIFRKEQLLFEQAQPSQRHHFVLLLQTDSDSRMVEVLKRLQDPEVSGGAPIRVFCSESKREFFQPRPEVDDLFPRLWVELVDMLAQAR